MAETVDVRLAVPFTIPRTAYAMVALFLVAGSLFALRYAVSHRLDLKPPLAVLLEQSFGEKTQLRAHPAALRPQKTWGRRIATRNWPRARTPERPPTKTPPRIPPRTQRRSRPPANPKRRAPKGRNRRGSRTGNRAATTPSKATRPPGKRGRTASGSQSGKEGNSKQDGNSSASQNSSLVSKLKDALQNLLSRMNPRDSQAGGEPQSGDQQKQQGKGQQKGGKQQSAKGGQQKGGQPQSDSQSDGSAAVAELRAGRRKGSGNSDAQQSSKQPGSGVGSQNGDKEIKQAQQLAAMGKISEIIGKRQQNISGETTVEVQSRPPRCCARPTPSAAPSTPKATPISAATKSPPPFRGTWSNISKKSASPPRNNGARQLATEPAVGRLRPSAILSFSKLGRSAWIAMHTHSAA